MGRECLERARLMIARCWLVRRCRVDLNLLDDGGVLKPVITIYTVYSYRCCLQSKIFHHLDFGQSQFFYSKH